MGGSRLVRSSMLPQPCGVAGLIERVVGERQHGGDHLCLLGQEGVAIFLEENESGQEGSAFIPIHKSVVLAQPGGVRGRQIAQIWFAVGN